MAKKNKIETVERIIKPGDCIHILNTPPNVNIIGVCVRNQDSPGGMKGYIDYWPGSRLAFHMIYTVKVSDCEVVPTPEAQIMNDSE